ncbi:MAG: M23 family metallopeptidase [Gemmatimonadales bacterium]
MVSALALPPTGSAQAPAPRITVRTIPALPVRGTIASLMVVPDPSGSPNDSLIRLAGTAADEPLHFDADGAGDGFHALLGIPLEGGDSVEVMLVLERSGLTDTTTVAFAVHRPSYPTERLRVDPRMIRYDSATRVRIESEIAQAIEVSRRSHETPRLWTEPFRPPRPGRITSRYGTGREFNGTLTSRHLGTDFSGKPGGPVRAAGRGVVALVADFFLAGRAVYLDHGGGLVTGYFHLSRVDAAAGDTVEAGGVVGGVGRTGRVTGPHLHWIARYGGISVDPVSLLALRY